MNNVSTKKLNITIIILLLISLAIIIYVAIVAKSDGGLCLKNPLQYGVNALEESNNAPMMCYCDIVKDGSPRLVFDGDTMEVEWTTNNNPSQFEYFTQEELEDLLLQPE